MLKCYRQGELLFIKVADIKALELKTIGEVIPDKVIREGEVSGHKHEVKSPGAVLLKKRNVRSFYQNDTTFNLPEGQMFLRSDNSISITHPEHKTLTLEKGDYVVRIQNEYTENGNVNVAD